MSKEGWTTVTLGDIAENISVRVDDPSKSGLERFVGLVHLDSGSVTVSKWDSTESVTSSMKQFQAGDVLLARRNAHLRRASAVDFEGVCSGDAYVLREKPDAIVPGLLKYILNTNRFWEYAIANADGSMSTRVKWKDIIDYRVRLQSTDNQIQSLEILEAMDHCLTRLRDVGSKHSVSKRKLLFDFTSGNASSQSKKQTSIGHLPIDWEVKKIGELGKVQMGRQRAPKYQTGNYSKPYLRVANVFDGFLDYSDVLQMDFDESDYEKYRLNRGDILLNEGQSLELVGRCAIYDGSIEGCCFQNTLIRFVAGEKLDPTYAFYMLQSMFYRRDFEAIASRTTSIAHLGATNFSKMMAAVPPLAIQRTYAMVLKKHDESDVRLNSLIAEIKSSLHSLIQTLLEV